MKPETATRTDDGLFLRKFLLRKKLRSKRPGAMPIQGMTCEECFRTLPDGRLQIWYDLAMIDGRVTTGAIIETREGVVYH